MMWLNNTKQTKEDVNIRFVVAGLLSVWFYEESSRKKMEKIAKWL